MRSLAALLLLPLLASCGDSKSGVADGDGGVTVDPNNLAQYQKYLRADPYRALLIEVDFVTGNAPRDTSETGLKSALASLVDKPDGITIVNDKTIASRGADHAWSLDELNTLADQTSDLPIPAAAVKMHVLFVDGHSDQDGANGKILGVAFNESKLVIFKQTIVSTCSSALPLIADQACAAAELAIWTHESGHLLGLVDNGLPMVTNHKDPAHGNHDISDQCIMYWAYDGSGLTDLIISRLTNGNRGVLTFDSQCLADIAAGKK